MDYEPVEDKIQKAREYLQLQKEGYNKGTSKEMLGYSRTNTSLEHTKAYQVALNETLRENVNVLQKTIDKVSEEMCNDKIDWNKAKLMTEVAKNLSSVHSVITPKVTIKETQNKDGTVTRTAWGTNASQLNETMQ